MRVTTEGVIRFDIVGCVCHACRAASHCCRSPDVTSAALRVASRAVSEGRTRGTASSKLARSDKSRAALAMRLRGCRVAKPRGSWDLNRNGGPRCTLATGVAEPWSCRTLCHVCCAAGEHRRTRQTPARAPRALVTRRMRTARRACGSGIRRSTGTHTPPKNTRHCHCHRAPQLSLPPWSAAVAPPSAVQSPRRRRHQTPPHPAAPGSPPRLRPLLLPLTPPR